MKILNIFLKLLPSNTAYAHCDIPCGIYDPNRAQLAAHTLVRMTDLLEKINRDNETKAEHDIARITHVKEKHADILEEELETLRNDYFKENHYKDYPSLADLFTKTFGLVSKSRQGIDIDSAKNCLLGVLEISEIFYKTKNVIPIRIKSIYPTKLEIVIYK